VDCHVPFPSLTYAHILDTHKTHVSWRQSPCFFPAPTHTAMHCNALQLCVKRCNTFALASSASHRSLTLQRTATHFSTQCSLQHTALHFERFLKHIATHFLAGSIDVQCLIHNATHCNALQRTATHCNTLQNTLQHISFTAVSVFHISCSLTHRCLLTHKCDRCLIHQVT